MNQIAVTCKHLNKKYILYKKPMDHIKYLLGGKKEGFEHNALTDINLTIKKGEIVGFIGMNGSGKSTLSRIIAGITMQTSGFIECNGKTNMLSVSSGLNPYMTGIENIRYKCLLMGISKRRTEELLSDIVKFSDLGEYIYQPLRTYSSGMRSRLGFAISVFIIPDILIIDEALSVGDMGFAAKCKEKMKQFKEENRTILYVSHSVGQMQGFCDRVIWLNNGRIIADDVPEHIILPYCAFARKYTEMTNVERKEYIPDIAEYQKNTLPHEVWEKIHG